MKKQCYLYKLNEQSTGKWYVGARFARNCHINDGYMSSSKVVKKLVMLNPSDWTKEILCIGAEDYIVDLERTYLQTYDAAHDPMSYNQHNADGMPSNKGMPRSAEWRANLSKARKGRSSWNKGKKMPSFERTPEHCAKISESLKGTVFSEERKRKISEATKGRPAHNKGKKMPSFERTPEHCARISEALKGKAKSPEHRAKNLENLRKINEQRRLQRTQGTEL